MAVSEAVVCDASVLASIAFGDPHSADARALTRHRRLFAPSLFRYELANVAVRRSITPGEDVDRVAQGFAAGLRVPVRLVEPSWQLVFDLARAHGLTAYDAAYLQVAVALQTPLATLDARLGDAAERLGIRARPLAE